MCDAPLGSKILGAKVGFFNEKKECTCLIKFCDIGYMKPSHDFDLNKIRKRPMYFRLCWAFSCFMLGNFAGAHAQIISTDINPPQIKWRQIPGEHFRLIYPSSAEKTAFTVAPTLDSLYHLVNKDLQARPRKMPIILQNQTVYSNGFVQLAPRKSEWYTTPPSGGENLDWMTQLSIHEMRHVAQFDQVVGRFRAPFFEQLGLALFGLHLPSWFFEGDAVWVESRLTKGGRGRTPSFLMPLRTNALSGKQFSYQKDYLGSYKDVTPGFYELGYAMVDQLAQIQGEEAAAHIMKVVSKNLIRPYSLNRAFKKQTGFSTKAWHKKTIQELTRVWEEEDRKRHKESYRTFPGSSGREGNHGDFPTDWLLPQAFDVSDGIASGGTASRRAADSGSDDGSGGPSALGGFLALKQGVKAPPKIVYVALENPIEESSGHISGYTEKVLVDMGWQTQPHFSARNNRIVWDEIRVHPRFGMQTHHVLVTYDAITKQKKQITVRSRLFSPSLSADGSRIVSVEVDEASRTALVIMDWEGRELQRVAVPETWGLQTPAFHENGDKIVAVVVSQHGTSLLEVDLAEQQFQLLFDWQFHQIERPVYWQNDVLFKAHFGGIDNIYVVKRDFPGEVSGLGEGASLSARSAKNGASAQGSGAGAQGSGAGAVRIQQVTHVRFGAFNPFVDASGETLWFNDYQLGGHQISALSLSDYLAREVEFNRPDMVLLLSADEGQKRDFFAPQNSGTAAQNSGTAPQNPTSPAQNATPGQQNGKVSNTSPDFILGRDSISSRPYSAAWNLFKFHSLSVSADEFSDAASLSQSIYLLSDNLLNTVQTRIGFHVDPEERSKGYSAAIHYQRFFPKFSVSYENKGRSGVARVIQRSDSSFVDHKLTWRENAWRVEASIPLSFYQYNHSYSFNFLVSASLVERYRLNIDPASELVKKNIPMSHQIPLRYAMSFGHTVRRSALDLGPRWGQLFSISYRHVQRPEDPALKQDEQSALFTWSSTFYFPGIMRNHSTVLRFNYQDGQGSYEDANHIPMVSGHDYLSPTPVYNTLLSAYRFPIAYPDWELGNMAYIKRIKGGIFADFQNVKPSNSSSLSPRTYGVELRADLHLFRYYLPNFDFGVKFIVDNHPAQRGKIHTAFGIGYSY